MCDIDFYSELDFLESLFRGLADVVVVCDVREGFEG